MLYLRTDKMSRPMFSGAMNIPSHSPQTNRSLSPPPPPQPVLSTSEKATKIELEAILRRPAHTPEEK